MNASLPLLPRPGRRHYQRLLCFAAVCALALPSPATALDFCVEPDAPRCIDSPFTYQSAESTQRCRSQLDRYLSEISAYLQCLDDLKLRYSEGSQRAAAKFQCKVNGGTMCR